MNYELLSRVYGTVNGLYWVPLLQPLGFDGASKVASWQVGYQKRGLPFGGDRATVEGLRKLTTAGMLETSGATQGKSWRLTTAGVLTAEMNLGLEAAGPRDLLQTIAEKETASKFVLPGTNWSLVMGWELCDDCGEWQIIARKSTANWATYQDRLSRLSVTLAPLLMLGYAKLFVDCSGMFWGVTLTDAGRSALRDWPTVPATDADKDTCFEAWAKGYDMGVTTYSKKNPPAEFQNIIARLLPASKWI